jgi:hypothetical protein
MTLLCLRYVEVAYTASPRLQEMLRLACEVVPDTLARLVKLPESLRFDSGCSGTGCWEMAADASCQSIREVANQDFPQAGFPQCPCIARCIVVLFVVSLYLTVAVVDII